jgi:hypothetical protein
MPSAWSLVLEFVQVWQWSELGFAIVPIARSHSPKNISKIEILLFVRIVKGVFWS